VPRTKLINGLTDKQRRFVAEYLVDQNGVRSAKAAGFKCPDKQASQLLQRPAVRQAIEKVIRNDLAKLEVTREEVLKQLYYQLTKKATDFVDEEGNLLKPHQMNERAQSVVDGIKQKRRVWTDSEGCEHEEVETELKTSQKSTAIEQGMKHKGLFAAEKSQVAIALVNWDQLMMVPGAVDEEEDPVEDEIRQLEGGK
jgi:phage terminase small subunit